MKYCKIDRTVSTSLLRISRICGLSALMILFVIGASPTAAATKAKPAAKPDSSPIVAKCKADLAKRLDLQVQDIKVADAQTMTWPNAALGMPEAGKVYAQVRTPGSKVILQARETRYFYTTSTRAFRYGGPIHSWSCSMLYIQPVKNEANLNGDLYQCSLLGTNSVRIASAVADYYPQEKGMVIIKRRTSRSGHELLYVRADKPGKETVLYHALDFGHAAANSAQDKWAGFVRPMLGTAWTVIMNGMNEDRSRAKTLPLPESVTLPGKIAWSGDTLMILLNKDDRMTAYEIDTNGESPAWKQVPAHTFPGMDAYMLNKSESLDIREISEDGKPGVEVARVWFTGDRNVVAKIGGFAMKGYDLLGPYAFVWGEKDSRPAAYAVDIQTGESLASFPGAGTNMKPFAYPVHDSPISLRK